MRFFESILSLSQQPFSFTIPNPATTSVQIAHDLSAILSPGANIIIPSDKEWANITERVATPRISPGYTVSVEVATEDDVAATVAYASKHDIDFLAVSGGHGLTTILNRLKNGIQINLRKLNKVELHADGSATLGPGILQRELVKELYKHGRQAVTGVCECVSVIGPLLGGGHSLLQSQYGFSLDNLLSANVVLGNGTATQASANTNPDLFWALRGAGHNFGIVTSFTIKTYEITSTYSVYTLGFAANQGRDLYELINKIEDPLETRDPKLFLDGLLIPSADGGPPSWLYLISYQGTRAELDIRARPFFALNPTSVTVAEDITYDQLHKVLGFGNEIKACQKNVNLAIAGVALPRWGMEGLEKMYDVFIAIAKDQRFDQPFVLLESYGQVAMLGVDPNSTALAREERERPILASLILVFDGDAEDTKKAAMAHVQDIKEALYTGLEKEDRHAYVNYAAGDESLHEIYGREEWRLEKLKTLKGIWDPGNKFRFYSPLIW